MLAPPSGTHSVPCIVWEVATSVTGKDISRQDDPAACATPGAGRKPNSAMAEAMAMKRRVEARRLPRNKYTGDFSSRD
ncbi:hypothetical protein GCM10009754_31310 [Amycolatopsis minnesotensis]|uniref:Uncharacterized protein n=1 Tax=Amycolatopsis minnesotensis TaxID=337894 RepID=A0ABP5C8S2_9PSEU